MYKDELFISIFKLDITVLYFCNFIFSSFYLFGLSNSKTTPLYIKANC